MGCYGIGISRMVAASIEQSHDEDGIIWPKNIAPYQILVLPVNISNQQIKEMALDIYQELLNRGWEVLFDDRRESAGKKFKDADLIGIPLRITIGNKALESKKYELVERRSKEKYLLSKEELINKIKIYFG
jgi:prolyl-tRNA synthetase